MCRLRLRCVDPAGESREARYLIAGPQKALLDELSTVPGIRSRTALTALLFDDLRIDQDAVSELDFTETAEWAGGYPGVAVATFLRSFRSGRIER